MRLPFCDYHILTFLESHGSSERPLDLSLSQYLRAHKSIGAHDRRTIGETLYGMMRWKGLIDHFGARAPLERLQCYRKILEKGPFDPTVPMHARLGVPEFLYKKLNGDPELCRIFNTEAPTTLRANLMKTSRDALYQALVQKFPLTFCKRAPAGLQLQKREALFALPEFKEGLFEVQDEGSQLVAELIAAKPGDHVLDYCSGSGGKTLAFAHRMQGKGQIYLYDNRPFILHEARKRLRRAGVQNAQFTLPKQKVDWLLTDVPCSGTGTLRRNPDAKWKINAPMIERLTNEQRTIVKEALVHLKPGGHFVYATCSILKEENEMQVQFFLETLPLTLVGEPLRLMPEEGGPDGFFAAVFKKQPVVK